jgi:signal recognition particle subunit SRP54
VVGGQAGVDVFAPEPGNGVGDPVAVARAGVEHARRTGHDIVVVDTAGRLGVDADMMAQAAAIRDAVTPDEILFVVDAMIGQDAVTTAEAFRDGVGFSGVVLTKLDGDARGGAALSVANLTGRPILFASTGEKLEDFDVFHPERMASRILGMGDVLSLIEAAERTFDADETSRMAEKMLGSGGGDLTLEDFLEQMMMVRRMGPIGNLLGMLPGMGQMKDALAQVDDKDLDRVAAIIRSMTPAERHDPKILNGSRRLRIARGSGVTVTEVNQLVDRFYDARKMMKQMAGGMGIPGMPGMRRPSKKGGRKGGKPGKPAKRSGGNPARGVTPPAALPQLPPGMSLPPGLAADLSNLKLPPD